MKSLSVYVALATLSGLGMAEVLSTGLEQRALGDRNEPHQVDIDCAGGEAVCNGDCYTILCLAGPNPVQYDDTASGTHRDESGAAIGPFRDSQTLRENRGIYISDTILNRIGRSPEETIMANTAQGGPGEILVPTQDNENRNIGARVGGQLSHLGVLSGQWYFKRFTNYGSGAPYCDDLQANPPDTSRCSPKDKPEDDPSRIAIIRKLERGPRDRIDFHMMNFDLGDRWTGSYWANSISKRNETELQPQGFQA